MPTNLVYQRLSKNQCSKSLNNSTYFLPFVGNFMSFVCTSGKYVILAIYTPSRGSVTVGPNQPGLTHQSLVHSPVCDTLCALSIVNITFTNGFVVM